MMFYIKYFDRRTKIQLDSIAIIFSSDGEVAEWLKAHAWKECVWQHTGGSNPPLSASFY